MFITELNPPTNLIYFAIGVLALAVWSLLKDIVHQRKLAAQTEPLENRPPGLPVFTVALLVFAGLFDTAHYWSWLAIGVVINIFSVALYLLLDSLGLIPKGKDEEKQSLIYEAGQYLAAAALFAVISIVIFILFYFDGSVGEPGGFWLQVAAIREFLARYWPYLLYTYLMLMFVIRLRNPQASFTTLLTLAAVCFLPLFMPYYWIPLSLGMVAFLFLYVRRIKSFDVTTQGGVAFVMNFMIMGFITLSILIYIVREIFFR